MLKTTYITQPSVLVIPVDKLSSELFGLDEDELNLMIKNKNLTHEFKESEPRYEEKSSKHKTTVTTEFKFRYRGDISEVITLTFFDQLILSACMTEFFRGITVVTPNIIFRDLGGKTYGSEQTTYQILQSINKLSQLDIRILAQEATQYLFQIKGNAFKNGRQGAILPVEETEVKLNGQPCSAYKILDESIVFEYARCKSQLIKVPINHLNVPHTKNTLIFMVLKIYVYMRILRILRTISYSKKSKKKIDTTKPQSILLDTLYQVCGFTEKINNWKFRMDLMKLMNKFMNHLVQCKVISSYAIVDNGKIPQTHLKDCTKILFVPIIEE